MNQYIQAHTLTDHSSMCVAVCHYR